MRCSCKWVPWCVELLGLFTLSLQNFSNDSSGVRLWHWCLEWSLLLSLCSGKAWLLVSSCLSLQSRRQQFTFVLPSKKSCWFFSVFSFLLVRTQLCHLSSSYIEPDTGNYTKHLCMVLLIHYEANNVSEDIIKLSIVLLRAQIL